MKKANVRRSCLDYKPRFKKPWQLVEVRIGRLTDFGKAMDKKCPVKMHADLGKWVITSLFRFSELYLIKHLLRLIILGFNNSFKTYFFKIYLS